MVAINLERRWVGWGKSSWRRRQEHRDSREVELVAHLASRTVTRGTKEMITRCLICLLRYLFDRAPCQPDGGQRRPDLRVGAVPERVEVVPHGAGEHHLGCCRNAVETREARGKRQEARGKRQEARGKRQEKVDKKRELTKETKEIKEITEARDKIDEEEARGNAV